MNAGIRGHNTRSWTLLQDHDGYSKSKPAISISDRSTAPVKVPPSSKDTEEPALLTDDCHKLRLTDGRTLYASRDLHTIPEEEVGVIHTILTVSTRHCRRNAVTDFGDFFEGLWDRLAESEQHVDENKPQMRQATRSRRCDAWDDLQFKEHFQTVSTCF